ncbi:hypothetical protein BDV09DRAFT_165908, partial [Aspergillus tetrazonus]
MGATRTTNIQSIEVRPRDSSRSRTQIYLKSPRTHAPRLSQNPSAADGTHAFGLPYSNFVPAVGFEAETAFLAIRLVQSGERRRVCSLFVELCISLHDLACRHDHFLVVIPVSDPAPVVMVRYRFVLWRKRICIQCMLQYLCDRGMTFLWLRI